jgi:hypothetical protein
MIARRMKQLDNPANRGLFICATKRIRFIASCNFVCRKSARELLGFLNNCTLVMPGWLNALLDTFAEEPELEL